MAGDWHRKHVLFVHCKIASGLKLNLVRYLSMDWAVWAEARILHTTCYEFCFIQVNVTLLCRNAPLVCMMLARITQYGVSYCYISFSRTSTRASFYIYIYQQFALTHDHVLKWKYFPCYWPFVRRIHRSPVNCLHKSQWHGALTISLISAWINVSVDNGEAGDSIHHRTHYNVIVMMIRVPLCVFR